MADAPQGPNGPELFEPKDSIEILAFLANFKMACDALEIHKGAAIWLFKPLMREPATSALNMGISPPNANAEPKEGQLNSYSAVVNYLLLTYASEDLIRKAEAELQRLKQGPKMSEHEYATELMLKALRCRSVYNEARLIGMFLEALHESIRDTVSSYWAEHPEADLNKLARYATSI